MSGPLATLGRQAHHHRLIVIGLWLTLTLGLGIFAPKLEHALSGAMWEVNGSDSLSARQVLEEKFGGFSSQSAVVVLNSDNLTVNDPAFQARIAEATKVLASEDTLTPPVAQPSQDGHTVMLQAGTLTNPTEAVRAAERIAGDIGDLSDGDITVALTGSPAFWGDFNAENREGMTRAEILTWPITAVILVLAFGTLAAAGLPLALTAAGLISSMGILYGITQFVDLSIWTLNFAMMFASPSASTSSSSSSSPLPRRSHATPTTGQAPSR
jgi:RND superfamily putative drug exporter